MNISLQAIIQISLGAKDVQTARKGFVIGGLVMLPVGFVAALLGVIASEMYPSISPTTALPQLIMSLNPWIAGITLASLWAADVSTACNLLLSAATFILTIFINSSLILKCRIRSTCRHPHFGIVPR